jgi:hypothetical protein
VALGTTSRGIDVQRLASRRIVRVSCDPTGWS